jgi:hypothetical protein
MSGSGPNAKCRRVLNLSAFRGIPEVIAHVQKLGRNFPGIYLGHKEV